MNQAPGNESLKLNGMERLFLHNFNASNDENRLLMVKRAKFAMVANIAEQVSSFEAFCYKPELNEHWNKLWCAYGVILTHQNKLPPVLFYAYSQANNFDLTRGAYFFHQSQRAIIDNLDFNDTEISFLLQAIKYGSCHAIQRFNAYLYHQLASSDSDEITNNLYNELITNSRKLLPENGSYGHMILAEAYSQYALWLLKTNRREKAHGMYNEAVNCFQQAIVILDPSLYSIHNASLGRGLKTSNSFEKENPLDAMLLVKEQFESNLNP